MLRGTLISFILLFATSLALPIDVDVAERQEDAQGSEVVLIGPEKSEDEDWQVEAPFSEGSMGKRSIALGRSGFRPGKRSLEEPSPLQFFAEGKYMKKRSMAIGRLGLRPGKRSMTMGRLHFRPGKRSMAYGRQGFRPGKRSSDMDVE